MKVSPSFSDVCLRSVETQEQLSGVSSGNLNTRLLHCLPSQKILHYQLSRVCLIYYQFFPRALDESKQQCSCISPMMLFSFNKVFILFRGNTWVEPYSQHASYPESLMSSFSCTFPSSAASFYLCLSPVLLCIITML